jgi:hypothetical protein
MLASNTFRHLDLRQAVVQKSKVGLLHESGVISLALNIEAQLCLIGKKLTRSYLHNCLTLG